VATRFAGAVGAVLLADVIALPEALGAELPALFTATIS